MDHKEKDEYETAFNFFALFGNLEEILNDFDLTRNLHLRFMNKLYLHYLEEGKPETISVSKITEIHKEVFDQLKVMKNEPKK